MSRDLLNSYEKDFIECMNQLRDILDDPSQTKNISNQNPYEYEQAQNYLKQMEIESMNLSDDNSNEGD